jgi:amino acid transporter
MSVQDRGRSGANAPGARKESELDAVSLNDDDYLASLGYKSELNRAIGLFSSFAVQFSSIGIISVTYVTLIVGLGYFGPASFWTWVVGGIFQVFFIGLAVAELVSAYPLAGGVYQINNRILGQVKDKFPLGAWLSWQSGWWIVVAHTVAVAAVAYLMTPFVANWFGYTDLSMQDQMWWALALAGLSTLINVIGVKMASLTNNAGVIAEVVAGVIIIGALLFVSHDWQPLSILNDTAGTTEGGWVKPLIFSFLLPLFMIQSFDSTGNAAEETVDAARKAPMGVFLANTSALVMGTAFVALLYLSIPDLAAVMGSSTPTNLILESALGTALTAFFEVLAVIALMANLVVIQLTGARVLWSQARDGEMPAAHVLRKVSKNKVPVNATLTVFAGVVIITVVSAQSAKAFLVLTGLTALAWAAAYGVVVAVGLYGLLTDKLPRRPFNLGRWSVPVFVVGTLWSIFGCILLIWTNPSYVGGGFVGAVAVGTAIYLCIPHRRPGRSASRPSFDEPAAS